jgi:hypothetical protein
VEIWADTFPPDTKLGGYRWAPEDKIINNGEPHVFLNTQTDERHTESYDINVSLIPFDNDDSPLPQPSPIKVRVVPPQQYNNKPEIVRRIRSSPEGQEVRAGDSFTLEAVATDDDREDRRRLRYDWYVENESAQVEGNGNSQVRIITPANLARYSSVPLRVRLTVSDGHEGGDAFDEATLMVVPKPRARTRRTGPPKYVIVVRQTPAPPQGANANAAATPISAAPPSVPAPQPPAKQPPGGAAPPQSDARPAKPLQGKEGAQDGGP